MVPSVQTQRRNRFRALKWLLLIVAGLLVVLATLIVLVALRGQAPKIKAKSKPNVHVITDLPAPQFSVAGGVYTNDISVSLTASSPQAVIRYTLDGTEPTTASRSFSNPIQIQNSTLLRAKVFSGRSSLSPIVSQAYIRLDRNLESFSSNLPLVIINSFGKRILDQEKVRVSAHFVDAKPGRSTLAGPANFDGGGNFNIRGHTSLRYPKHSYHFKIRDEEQDPQKFPLLGFPKDSDWVLYAPFPDKTLMRDVLGYEISNQMGRYASRTKFVEVFVNETGGRLSKRDYVGVYVLAEKTKRGKHRLDIEKMGPEDETEPNVTGGYIFKKDHLDTVQLNESNPGGFPRGGPSRSYLYSSGPGGFPANPEGFRSAFGNSQQGGDGFFQRMAGRFSPKSGQLFSTSRGHQFFYVEPQADEITLKQKAWLTAYLDKFESVLEGDNFKDPKLGYAAYIDPASFIDHHLLVEVMKNIDGFRFSTFYHKDRDDKLKMGPIWDWNLSLGNANGKEGYLANSWYWPQLNDQQYLWFRRLFEDPDFAQRYVDRWGEVRTNQFAVGRIHARIDELAVLLDEAQARNFQRWRIMGRSVWPNSYVGRSFSDEVDWMKQWIQKRIEWIDQQFLAAPTFSLAAGPVARGSSLELRAPMGKVYYTLDGSDPRALGGAVSPSANSFGSPVVLNEDTTLFCRAFQGNRWSYPGVRKFYVTGGKTASGNAP